MFDLLWGHDLKRAHLEDAVDLEDAGVGLVERTVEDGVVQDAAGVVAG